MGLFPAAVGDFSAFGARRFDHIGSEDAYSRSDYNVDFIISSATFPGNSEVHVVFDPSAGMAEQFRYYPEDAFAQFGVYPPSNPVSANYPTSELSVAATPEPSTIVLLGAGLFGMFGLRRRPNKRLYPRASPIPLVEPDPT